MTDWFIGLFTLPHLAYFGLGVVSSFVWHLTKAWWQRRIMIIRWKYIAVPLVMLIAAYTAVANQQNANCVREFNQTLRERATISTENDAISLEQRTLIYRWMHDLVFPPPELADLELSDPARERWNLERTLHTDELLRESLEKQRDNDARRAANPLPPPTCGQR